MVCDVITANCYALLFEQFIMLLHNSTIPIMFVLSRKCT